MTSGSLAFRKREATHISTGFWRTEICVTHLQILLLMEFFRIDISNSRLPSQLSVFMSE